MNSRRLATWRKVAALAPLFLLVVSLPGQNLLRCRIDGLVRSVCCCPAEADTDSSEPVVKAQDCCDREVSVGAQPGPVVEPSRRSAGDTDTTWADPGVAPVSLVTFAFAAPNRLERPWPAHAPPHPGPSIVLLKQAFLI